MKKATCLAVVMLICLMVGPKFSRGAEEKTPETIAWELLQISRLPQVGEQILERVILVQKKRMPNVPEQFWADFKNDASIEGLNEKIIKIYTQHFSVSEMEDIVGFYKTDTGQKFLNKLPDVTQASMAASKAWGMELRAQMAKRLQETDLGKAGDPAQP